MGLTRPLNDLAYLAAKERDRDHFLIWIRHGVSAVVFMILPSMILLNQNFAKSWRAKS